MGRKIGRRMNKNFFDPMLAAIGGDKSNKYVDAFHRDAAKKIELHHLMQRIRRPVNEAGVAPIPDSAVIYGIYNTEICKKVTLETLRSRMGVAAAIADSTRKPGDKLTYKQMVRARKLTEMHEPLLERPQGPFEGPQ